MMDWYWNMDLFSMISLHPFWQRWQMAFIKLTKRLSWWSQYVFYCDDIHCERIPHANHQFMFLM